jgi:hypothetical protein
MTPEGEEEGGLTPSLLSSAPPTALSDGQPSSSTSAVETKAAQEDASYEAAPDGGPDMEEMAALLTRVRAEKAALNAQLLRDELDRELAELAALRARVHASPPPTPLPTASGTQTPAPAPAALRPRVLFASAMGKRTPSASSVARQALIDQLPIQVVASGAASVVLNPVVAVDGSSTSHVIHGTARAAAAPVASSGSSKSSGRSRPDKPTRPPLFTGDDRVQNEKVESWVRAVNNYFELACIPVQDQLKWATSLCSPTGSVDDFLMMTEEDVSSRGRVMTWDFLQAQMIGHYAHRAGRAAEEAEWSMLKMGVKPSADGKDVSKSTRTVSEYNTLFLHYLRRLSQHTSDTKDLTVIQKYVGGIRDGYPALYVMMKGVKASLQFDVLQDAMDEARLAEANLSIGKMEARASSSVSSWAGPRRFGGGGHRAATESLNNLQGEYSDEGGEGGETAGESKTRQVNNFRFIPQSDDGRYKLAEKEQQMLYTQKRCYRCYGQHPVGPRAPPCTKPVMKTAPRPLN